MASQLRIGYVPEHFSTPLHFAQKYYNLNAKLIPFPSGTGHMVQSLKAEEIDVGIGLTEGWVAALGKEQGSEKPFSIVGTYVETPLCWAISTGPNRHIKSMADLKGGKIGVSRIGSGSYVMGFVLADQNGWLKPGEAPFENIVLNDFRTLREGVNSGKADFFMWEHFTSKRYYDNGEIRRVGEIYTPWSSWKIVSADGKDGRLEGMFESVDKGVQHFEGNQEEAVKYIYTELDYSEKDAREWLKTVEFTRGVKGVDRKVIEKTVGILEKAGVLEEGKVDPKAMIAYSRS